MGVAVPDTAAEVEVDAGAALPSLVLNNNVVGP